jgi:methyl-accepting chemotaxis protein
MKDGGEENPSSVLESLASLNGFTSQIHQIAESISGSADEAFREAQGIQGRVEQMATAVELSRKENLLLLEESSKIHGVLELLREISESTHVLGINAAILSARAGTAGKAFGVLAKEIRGLADRSSQSLGIIEDIVTGLRQRIGRVSARIEESDALILGQKQGLLSVAGRLQGTVLGVNVIHAVSGTSADLTSTLLDEMRGVPLGSRDSDRLEGPPPA